MHTISTGSRLYSSVCINFHIIIILICSFVQSPLSLPLDNSLILAEWYANANKTVQVPNADIRAVFTATIVYEHVSASLSHSLFLSLSLSECASTRMYLLHPAAQCISDFYWLRLLLASFSSISPYSSRFNVWFSIRRCCWTTGSYYIRFWMSNQLCQYWCQFYDNHSTTLMITIISDTNLSSPIWVFVNCNFLLQMIQCVDYAVAVRVGDWRAFFQNSPLIMPMVSIGRVIR